MFQKTIPQRNPHLLAMAKGKPCLMRVPGVCCGDPATVVAAHSNQIKHGKAKARKADDCFSVWACHTCHAWYDQGAGARDRKVATAAFNTALVRQVTEWARIILDPLSKPKDKAAADWAIARLREADMGVFEINVSEL